MQLGYLIVVYSFTQCNLLVVTMPIISVEAKRRVLLFKEQGYSMSEIIKRLNEEGIIIFSAILVQIIKQVLHIFTPY